MSFLKRIPGYIRFLLACYVSGVALFTVPRLLLLLTHWEKTEGIPAVVLLQALWMGYRFDTVISGYLLALPLLVLGAGSLLSVRHQAVHWSVGVTMIVLYAIAFFICASDIPYFNYFNTRLTVSVLNWTDSPGFMAGMVLGDPSYYPYIFLFLVLSTVFGLLIVRFIRRMLVPGEPERGRVWVRTAYFLLAALLLFVAIRGRISFKSPIRWGTASFSTYALPNALGLNPVYTFTRSWLDRQDASGKPLQLIHDREALETVQHFLGVPQGEDLNSPIARHVTFPEPSREYNVILVLMENMAGWKVGCLNNGRGLTPHLDALATDRSYLFTDFYSAGTHTFNGVYSTLFSFPTLLSRHPMKSTESMQPFTGLAHTLSSQGYQTIFFTTHDEQFDNMGGFLSANGFQRVVSQKDYPSGEILSTLGVPDHYLFEFSLPFLNGMFRQGKPFLAAFLTASDHGPYIIPEHISFRPATTDIKQQIVEYADWSIGRFIQSAKREPWYNNTIFVFLADHGSVHNPVYDVDLSYHRIPLIIHCPDALSRSEVIGSLGGQIDVFPTIMGLLRLPYINNTEGMDLLREQRPFIFFNADDDLGCLNHQYYWIGRRDGRESLYRYRERSTENRRDRESELADSMRVYARSMIQATQHLISKRLVGTSEKRTIHR